MKEYLKSADEVLKDIESTQNGLTSEQAKQRLEKNGLNKLKEPPKDGIVKKFIKALQNLNEGEFIDVNKKEGIVNFYIYTDPDIQPSKSVYTGKTIDVNSNVKKVSFEEIYKTLELGNNKYTYNIEFVDKDWNMSKEQFDNLYRQHNRWKNMRF